MATFFGFPEFLEEHLDEKGLLNSREGQKKVINGVLTLKT